MCSRAITKWPGNRCFKSTFQSPSMWRCQCQLRKIVAWKKTSIEKFSSLFSGCWTRKSLGISNTSICNLAETTSSKSRWCKQQFSIFDDSQRWFVRQKLSQQETCNHPTRHYNLSDSICPSTMRITRSMLRVGNVLVMRCLNLSQSLRNFLFASSRWLPCKEMWASNWALHKTWDASCAQEAILQEGLPYHGTMSRE